MNRRKFILGTGSVTLGGSALIVSGSGAFSRSESHRVVRIQPADDENAYLGLEVSDRDVDCDDVVTLVTLTNQLKQDTILEVDGLIKNDDIDELNEQITIEILGESMEKSFAVGESIQIEIDVSCEPGVDDHVDIQFGVEVTGMDGGTGDEIVRISAQPVGREVPGKNREIRVGCSCPISVDGLSFIAFCGDIDEEAVEFEYILTEDNVVEGVSWSRSSGELDTVVLFGGGLDQTEEGKQEFLNFEVGDEVDGVAMIGDQDETVPRNPPEETSTGQTPDCPCPNAGSGVKFNLQNDGSIQSVDEFSCD